MSRDLEHRSLRPPLFRSKVFGQLEVPQVFEHQGRWYCLFCTAKDHIEPTYCRKRMSESMKGTHDLIADHPLGEWKLVEEDFPVGNAADRSIPARSGRSLIRCPSMSLMMAGLQVDASRYGVGGPDRLAGQRQDRDTR
ncbi:hypothetical protein VSR68_35890 [Paraburkholderia phymatum]|uniref:hypothetical protein n=1 Tax=Paraburkholderia phymatum TaxID=148447 RepID=UPI00317C2E0E